MSFSLETKIEAALFPLKKTCCRRAFINGILLTAAEAADNDITVYLESLEIAELCAKLVKEQFGREASLEKGGRGVILLQFNSKSAGEYIRCAANEIQLSKFVKCEECITSFLRGAFVGGGTVNEPNKKNYHLEIKSRSDINFEELANCFEESGFLMKISDRLSRRSIYTKESGLIGDLLFFICANKQAFDFMNAKIGHEIKNDINRRTNCETSNIARSTASAAKHISAIKFLVERGRLSELGPELEYTAQMRLKYPEMSLVQLGQSMTPTVSKPGLYHRLGKICTFADNIKNKEE